MSAPGAGQAEGEWHVVGIRYCFPRDPHTKTCTHIPLLMDGQICILGPESPCIKWNPKPGLSAYRSSIGPEGSERDHSNARSNLKGYFGKLLGKAAFQIAHFRVHVDMESTFRAVPECCPAALCDSMTNCRTLDNIFSPINKITDNNSCLKYATWAGSWFSSLWCKRHSASSAPSTICRPLHRVLRVHQCWLSLKKQNKTKLFPIAYTVCHFFCIIFCVIMFSSH